MDTSELLHDLVHALLRVLAEDTFLSPKTKDAIAALLTPVDPDATPMPLEPE